MNETFLDLAADASAYLKALRDRDVPHELAEILVHDWHTARLHGLFAPVSTDVKVLGVETFDGVVNGQSKIVIKSAPGMDAEQLAKLVIQKITEHMRRRRGDGDEPFLTRV